MSSELEDLSRPVIELRGVHGANNSDVVYDLRSVGQKAGEPCTRLAVLLELPWRFLQLWCSTDESEAFTVDQTFRNRFLVALGQGRLVVEHVYMRYSAGLIQIDDAFRLRREVKWMNTQTLWLVFSLCQSLFG